MMELFSEENIWIFGMVLNIFGSVMVNFGTNLMKSSHNISESKTTDRRDSMLTAGHIWAIGMSIFVVGSLVNFASFAFAAQSLLAALGTVQFISNVFFAKFILNEILTLRIILATLLIMFGLVIAIFYSNHVTDHYTTQDLIDLYTPGYIKFLLILGIILILTHCIYIIYTHHEKIGKPLPNSNLMRPVTYSIVSATIGTQSVLQSKCLAELLKETIANKNNQFDNFFLYIILLIFILGLAFWLYRMNSALKQFNGLVIIPLLQVFWTTSAILQGGVYFGEFTKFSTIQSIGFTFGIVIVFIGVYLLTPDEAQVSADSFEVDRTGTGTGAGMDSSERSEISLHSQAQLLNNNYKNLSNSISTHSSGSSHGNIASGLGSASEGGGLPGPSHSYAHSLSSSHHGKAFSSSLHLSNTGLSMHSRPQTHHYTNDVNRLGGASPGGVGMGGGMDDRSRHDRYDRFMYGNDNSAHSSTGTTDMKRDEDDSAIDDSTDLNMNHLISLTFMPVVVINRKSKINRLRDANNNSSNSINSSSSNDTDLRAAGLQLSMGTITNPLSSSQNLFNPSTSSSTTTTTTTLRFDRTGSRPGSLLVYDSKGKAVSDMNTSKV